jgi:hypothetical protein
MLPFIANNLVQMLGYNADQIRMNVTVFAVLTSHLLNTVKGACLCRTCVPRVPLHRGP